MRQQTMQTMASDNGLSPGRRQAIIWINAGLLSIGTLGINFSELLIDRKCIWKCRLQNGLNALTKWLESPSAFHMFTFSLLFVLSLLHFQLSTHWGRDKSPYVTRQAIIWTNDGLVYKCVTLPRYVQLLRHGPLARYVKLRVRMRRECRERFPRNRG